VRSAISAKIRAWVIAQQNAAEKEAARTAQGHHGKEGGRGYKNQRS
jgi:hypothetical protein